MRQHANPAADDAMGELVDLMDEARIQLRAAMSRSGMSPLSAVPHWRTLADTLRRGAQLATTVADAEQAHP